MIKALVQTAICTALSVIGTSPASAHAFGARYDLPLPLNLYLYGAAAVVALSFAAMALFVKERPSGSAPATSIGYLLPHSLVLALQIISVLIFLLIIIVGLMGVQSPTKNFASTMVWVIWWVGFAFLSALIGNLWRILNPFIALFTWGEWIMQKTFTRPQPSPRPYPSWLGFWPALAFFLTFAWLELISEAGERPAQLSWLIMVYAALNWMAMSAYGARVWSERGEGLGVVFSTLARFAPLNIEAQEGHRFRLSLRPYAVGLLTEKALPTSAIVLVIAILSTVSFDGFLETPAWAAILDWLTSSRALRGSLISLQEAGVDLLKLFKTLALLIGIAFFVAVFLFTSLLIRLCAEWGGGPRLGILTTSGYFVLSLVPIAIAYHLAHYYSYLMLAGQLIIPLSSDPFGWGWNLFGTAVYRLDVSVVNAKFVWYLAIIAIVSGHVAAVFVAHMTAMRIYGTRKAANMSQIPMLLLMVGYTMTSLWILSQPIVETG